MCVCVLQAIPFPSHLPRAGASHGHAAMLSRRGLRRSQDRSDGLVTDVATYCINNAYLSEEGRGLKDQIMCPMFFFFFSFPFSTFAEGFVSGW